MKVRWLFASMAASLSLPSWAAQSEAADISMAIHEGGFSVVEEARRITVAKGDSTLALDGLPDGVQPDTLVANFAAGSACGCEANGSSIRNMRCLTILLGKQSWLSQPLRRRDNRSFERPSCYVRRPVC